MKIVISGPAQATSVVTGEEVHEARKLQKLDGLLYDKDLCSNYIDSGPLADIGIQGGEIRLAFSEVDGLRVVTEYRAPRGLNDGQLKKLAAFTRAQWSDGIGESAFLHREITQMDVNLDPLGRKATITTAQIDDGIVTPPPPELPLIRAILKHKPDKLESLISKGAEIDAADRNGNTALCLACLYGYFPAAELLLRHHASATTAGAEGRTPLALLAMCNTIDHPATLHLAEQLLKHGSNIDARDKKGWTPLAWAANRGKVPLIKLLISRGADPNSRDSQKNTVLMHVQELEVANVLLENGADPSLRNANDENAAENVLHNRHWTECQALSNRFRTFKSGM